MPETKILFLDCDSTLSAIEGVDELAELRGPDAFAEVKALTDQAMDGEVPIDEVFARRLKIIQPSRDDCKIVGQRYLDQIEPSAMETVKAAQAAGWSCVILSGGFTQVIEPLALRLGIKHIEAVGLEFDVDGKYYAFDEKAPTTRNGGKPEVIEQWKARNPGATTVMVGDGVSDLEAAAVTDRFIGFGGFTDRPAVKAGAEHFVTKLSEILPLLP